MANPAKYTPSTSYPREVRLGLVLFGGVSLAIYMNGIALEFFRAVRGRGLYGFLKEITNSEITVDVVSGTSAGGINGLFLAFALANNVDFACFSKLWEEQGALGKLIHRLLYRNGTDALPASVLDGESYYQPALFEALSCALNQVPTAKEEEERPAAPYDIDLFITGTDFHGEASTLLDDNGHAIDVLNYRRLFHLSHRQESLDESNLTPPSNREQKKVWLQALSKLAALTSSFPVAFAPVKVDGSPADALLREWGGLDGKVRYFIDGGVLANKPFTPTIDAIFRRSADRIVDRYLCYVEPNPELLLDDDAGSRAPSAWRNALAALTTLPRYQSISVDLRLLVNHNSAVEQYTRLCKSCRGHAADIPLTDVYRKARMLSLSTRVLNGIFLQNGKDPLLVSEPAKQAAAHMIQSVEDLLSTIRETEVWEILTKTDVYFRRRRLTHLSYWVTEKLIEDPSNADLRTVKRTINGLNKILEAIQDEMGRLLDNFEFCWQREFRSNADFTIAAKQLWERVYALLEDFLKAPNIVLGPTLPDSTQIANFRLDLRKRADFIIKTGSTNTTSQTKNLLVLTEELERELLLNLSDFLAGFRDEYNQFHDLDNLTFPTEFASGLNSKDIIKVVRFSPIDARSGACSVRPKVLGRQANAFGAFFKKDWRQNDILFGRLDGVCQLTDLMLGKASRANALKDGERCSIKTNFINASGDFNDGYHPKTFFPNCDLKVLEPAFRSAIAGCWSEEVKAELIKAEQHEIYLQSAHLKRGLPYGQLARYLQNEYTVRNETPKNLWRLASLPVAAKAAGAATLLLAALALRSFRRT